MKKILAVVACMTAVVAHAESNTNVTKGTKMSVAKSGDTVKIHYTGTLNDGSKFDSSEGRAPLEFKIGSGQVIPGFDKAATGLAVGEEKTVTIPAAEAYGAHDANLVNKVDRAQMPKEITLEKGLQLNARSPQGGVMTFVVVDFDDKNVTLDANHPLAGKDLTFKVKLVSIN